MESVATASTIDGRPPSAVPQVSVAHTTYIGHRNSGGTELHKHTLNTQYVDCAMCLRVHNTNIKHEINNMSK